LHDIIALRLEVFVVEQDCPYQDLDGKDKQCWHLWATDERNEVVATLRLVPPGLAYSEPAIGRVVSDPKHRGKGLGHQLMEHGMALSQRLFPGQKVRLSAQSHLEAYYRKHSFVPTGKSYLEDGIPHIEMLSEK